MKSLTFTSATFFSELTRVRQSLSDLTTSSFSRANGGNIGRKIKNFFKNSFYIPLGIFIVVILVLVGFSLKNSMKTTANSDTRPEVQKSLATISLNKSLTFPTKDETGKEVSRLKYTIQSAELTNEVILNGQRVPTIQGRTILLLNIKLTNDFSKPVQVNVRDYTRLMVNKKDEKYAPDLHSDPVEAQAGATKLTRVGFFINETDKDLVLSVGEYLGNSNSKKERIELPFNR